MATYFSRFTIFLLLCAAVHAGVRAQETTMDPKTIKVDTAGIVVPDNNYVLLRQPYRATIYLPPIDSGYTIEVRGAGGTITMSKDNRKAYIEGLPNTEGVKKWSGYIKIRHGDTVVKNYMLPITTYTVYDPMASIELENANVMYVGLENHIRVRVPDFLKDKVRFTIDNGPVVTGENGYYTVTSDKVGQFSAGVYVEYEPGKPTLVRRQDVRMFRLRLPHAKFCGKKGGMLTKPQAAVSDKMYTEIEDFDFAAHFTITHFTLLIRMPLQIMNLQFESTEATLTPEMREAMAKVESGAIIIFMNIEAEGPDHIKRHLDPISFIVE